MLMRFHFAQNEKYQPLDLLEFLCLPAKTPFLGSSSAGAQEFSTCAHPSQKSKSVRGSVSMALDGTHSPASAKLCIMSSRLRCADLD